MTPIETKTVVGGVAMNYSGFVIFAFFCELALHCIHFLAQHACNPCLGGHYFSLHKSMGTYMQEKMAIGLMISFMRATALLVKFTRGGAIPTVIFLAI